LLDIRLRKPWSRLRLILLGWKVRFTVHTSRVSPARLRGTAPLSSAPPIREFPAREPPNLRNAAALRQGPQAPRGSARSARASPGPGGREFTASQNWLVSTGLTRSEDRLDPAILPRFHLGGRFTRLEGITRFRPERLIPAAFLFVDNQFSILG
jgi:hypothetical protein